MKRNAIERLLDLPSVYSWFTDFIGGDARSRYEREYVRSIPGQRIIDIGCGPADMLRVLSAGVEYVGVDVNPLYINAARARFGDRGSFYCQSVSADFALPLQRFDVALSIGVLHHLDDTQALELLALARSSLAKHGRFLTLDGCYISGQPALARLLLHLDRGKHVRAPEAYVALAERVFGTVAAYVRDDLLRVPYTHIIMECRP